MERTQDAEAIRALQEELETTREKIDRYGQLIEELPWIFEQKFSERLAPVLERRQRLLEEQAVLQGRLEAGSAGSPHPALLPGEPEPERTARPWLPAACLVVLAGIASALILRTFPSRPPATAQPSDDGVPALDAAPDPGQRIGERDSALSVTVRPGDTLGEIAGRHAVGLQQLMQANGLTDPHRLDPGLQLNIPSEGQETSLPRPTTDVTPAPQATPRQQGGQETITVKPGETAGEIAERHGVELQRLLQANGITDPRLLEAGQTLSLPDPRGREAGPDEVRVTVMSGETLSMIAERHGISLQRLLTANELSDPDRLREGQTLIVPPPAVTTR